MPKYVIDCCCKEPHVTASITVFYSEFEEWKLGLEDARCGRGRAMHIKPQPFSFRMDPKYRGGG